MSNLEKDIVKFIPKEYEWMARDEDGDLFIYADNEPFKYEDVWKNNGRFEIFPLEKIFEQVKWTDEMAWKFKEEK